MDLNWSTFVFEIVNFLILVWILHRFLYKPVLAVIARRRESIDKTLADAQSRFDEALALQAQYENRLTDWEQEKQAARDALQREIETEKTRLLQELDKTLAREREKARAADERRLRDAARRDQAQALEQGARFTTRLLERIADAALEARLIDLVLEDLTTLPEQALATLRAAYRDHPVTARIASAYELAADRREALQGALSALVDDTDLACEFNREPELAAGLRITIGAWVMHANLRDELQGFIEAAHAA